MKKLIFFLSVLVFCGCAKTVQIACNEPDIEVFIDEKNYGTPPVLLRVPYNVYFVNASFRRNGMILHTQRINFVDGQNYYEITLPRHLQKSGNHKYHSNH